MTEAFDLIKATLQAQGALTDEEIAKITAEHSELTDEERTWLSAELHKRKRMAEQTVTVEQFLEANKVLDDESADDEAKKKAQEIVDAFLKGS